MHIEDLRNYYWLKEELVRFCGQLGIPATGQKLEILARIEAFLHGERFPEAAPQSESTSDMQQKTASRNTSAKRRDSDAPLTLETPIVNFKSDQKTREFFKSVVGPHFHFTAHMGDFMRDHPQLTYGEYAQEWQAEYERRKNADYKPPIMKSCEYNQFVRDFFADEQNQGKSLRDAISAWNEVKRKHGARKYRRQTTSDNVLIQK